MYIITSRLRFVLSLALDVDVGKRTQSKSNMVPAQATTPNARFSNPDWDYADAVVWAPILSPCTMVLRCWAGCCSPPPLSTGLVLSLQNADRMLVLAREDRPGCCLVRGHPLPVRGQHWRGTCRHCLHVGNHACWKVAV